MAAREGFADTEPVSVALEACIMDSAGVEFVSIPIWLALPVLVVVLFGAFKLVKLLVLALRG